MEQPTLCYCYEDGLRDDVLAAGGFKVIGKLLFPEKDVEAAARTLSDKLNPGRRDRLTDEQERLIMARAREARRFSAALAFTCEQTGFSKPAPLDPEDEKAKLQREVIEAARTVRAAVEKLERMAQTPLTVVRP